MIGVELVILFCDTSALMKLLVDETQSDQIRQISTTVDAIGVCRISWAETMAVLARLQREDPVCNEDLEQARQHLIQSWKTFTIVEVSQPLVETAGRFADVFALRGYDSVQLAAAHELHINAEQSVLFACYDRRLNQAAQLLQLEVLP
jgi:predicted nucleic acid-binding protein